MELTDAHSVIWRATVKVNKKLPQRTATFVRNGLIGTVRLINSD